MSHHRMVYHDGIVVGVSGNHVRVKIISKSACAGCHAKNVCNASEMDEKMIDAVAGSGQSFQTGETVTLVMEERLGWIAIFYAFGLPFIVMIAILILFSALGHSETIAALAGLASLLPYYLLLYLFRKKVEKDFLFRVERKHAA